MNGNLEIERKFLVTGRDWDRTPGVHILQGYLARETGHSVRVRIADVRAWISVKGGGSGIVRQEFEYAIPVDEAREILKLCMGTVVEKIRHTVTHAGLVWEVDEFRGANDGLVMAEVELDSPGQQVALPDWIGQEVTDEPRFFNTALSRHPYTKWGARGLTGTLATPYTVPFASTPKKQVPGHSRDSPGTTRDVVARRVSNANV